MIRFKGQLIRMRWMEIVFTQRDATRAIFSVGRVFAQGSAPSNRDRRQHDLVREQHGKHNKPAFVHQRFNFGLKADKVIKTASSVLMVVEP